MRKFKKITFCLALGVTIAGIMTGCKGKNAETETASEPMTETRTIATEVETKEGTATTIKTKTYTSRDKRISIILPDSTWKNTKDTADELVFEAGKGSITITHISGSSVASVKLPASKEEVLNNLKSAGKDTTKYEVADFSQKKLGTKDQYHTIVKCTDSAEEYVYSVGYDLVSTTEIYSVTGLVKEDNETALKEIQTAVESFKVLKSSSSSTDTTTGQTESGTVTGSTQVIYDSNGNPITVTKDASGIWKDSTGKTYDMQQYGVMGSDGYWYTYQGGGTQPETSGSETSAPSTESTEAGGNNNTPGATSGFYDQDGNYISVTKDANGNWVDSYGTTYYFGDDGVTDNAGNYYPYGSSGGESGGETSGSVSNGFYDSNGNYVTVVKDANGNWVDSSGGVYTFGDTGVTDEAGNFYPY